MSNVLKPETSSSIESRLIKEVKYDPFMQVMTVYFWNGSEYEYIDVPEETYQELLQAESAGKYFHSQVRGKFHFLRRV